MRGMSISFLTTWCEHSGVLLGDVHGQIADAREAVLILTAAR